MRPLQLYFLSSHKGPVLQGYLLPLAGAGFCFLSIHVCFWGGGLGSSKENQLLKRRTEHLSFMQGPKLLPLLFSHLLPLGHGCPRGVCLAADLPPAIMMLVVPLVNPLLPSREVLFEYRLVKNSVPKTRPSWEFLLNVPTFLSHLKEG